MLLASRQVLVLITATSWESSKWSLRAQDISRLVCASKRFSFLVIPAQSEDLWNKMASHFVHLVAGMPPLHLVKSGRRYALNASPASGQIWSQVCLPKKPSLAPSISLLDTFSRT